MALTKITSDSIQPGAITSDLISADVSLGVKISNVAIANSSYTILDDTAVDTAGGYIVITGAGFNSGAQVIIGGTNATSVTRVSSTELRAQVPAKSAATYNVYVVNTDGSTGIRVNGLTYSSLPTWVTGSTLDPQQVDVAFNLNFDATSAVSYANTSAIPAGTTLLANGYFYGTITGITEETTYSFTVQATDAENQDSPRTFSVTVTVSQAYRTDTFASNLRLALPFDQTYQFSDIAYKIDGSPNTTSISQLNSSKSAIISSGATKWSAFGYTSSYYEATKVSPACKYTLPATLDPRTNFTIEGWFYPTGTNNNWTISSADVNGRFLIEVTTGTENYLFSDQAQIKVPAGAWYHVAITNTNIYVNGVSKATGSFTNTGFTTLHVGQFNDTDGNNYLGYIQDLRVYIGVKKYTSNFTPGNNSIIEDYGLITPL